jgi:hypothetical protein
MMILAIRRCKRASRVAAARAVGELELDESCSLHGARHHARTARGRASTERETSRAGLS